MFNNPSENLNTKPKLTLYTKLWYGHISPCLLFLLWLQQWLHRKSQARKNASEGKGRTCKFPNSLHCLQHSWLRCRSIQSWILLLLKSIWLH